jgi:recombination protein RecT
VMRRSEINKVRQASQTGATGKTDRQGNAIEPKGPWVDWFAEMAKKTVLRRHSKSLPMSGDVFADVEGADMDNAARSAAALLGSQPGGEPQQIEDHTDEVPHDPDTGEIIDTDASQADDSQPAADEQPKAEDPAPTGEAQPETPAADELSPAQVKANEIVGEITAAISIMDVNSIESRSKPDMAAMDDELANYVQRVIDTRKAEIKASRQQAKPAQQELAE